MKSYLIFVTGLLAGAFLTGGWSAACALAFGVLVLTLIGGLGLIAHDWTYTTYPGRW